jgi:methyl-galactoside transport system permease protein
MANTKAETKTIRARIQEIKREDVTSFLLNYALYFILGTLLVIVIIIDPKFASVTNIINIIKQASTKGILALGVAGLIVLAGTDLSIGRVMGFAAAVTASLVQSVTYSARYYPQITAPVNLLIPLFLSIVIATAFSLINGFGAAYLKMHPFIVTLGTQLIAFGCNCIYIERQPSGTAQALSTFERNFLDKAAGSFSLGEIKIPFVVIYFLICAFLVHIIWTRTKLGKNMFAVGGNEEAARVSGVSVPQTIMMVYLMAGICYGIAAFLETARVQSVGANTGINYELDAISACVIGGVSFFGGVGTIMGVVIGSILLQSINYSLYFLGVNAYMQYIIRGLIIVIAVAIDVRKYIAKR